MEEIITFLRSKFSSNSKFESVNDTTIQITSTRESVVVLDRDFTDLRNKLKNYSLSQSSETIYKYTVMTAAKDALRYRLTQGLNLTKDDAKKQQTYKTMLDENKLDQLNIEPPLPSK